MLLLQFKDIMILILFGAAAVAAFTGDIKDAIVILVIVVLNAIAGFIQEYRAEKAMDALKKMSVSPAKVRRDNTIKELSSTHIVPGDIVVLEAGNMVPADLRIVETQNRKIDESSMSASRTRWKRHTIRWRMALRWRTATTWLIKIHWLLMAEV